MDNSIDRERITKEIAKMSDSIRKKYRALKTGKMARDIALKRHFKPIIDPLKQIVENTAESSKDPAMTEKFFSGENEEPKLKRKRPSALYYPIQASTPEIQSSNFTEGQNPMILCGVLFDVTDEPLVTSIRHLQTSEGQEKLHANYGPLGQKYMKAVLSGKKAVNIDVVYGVYFSDEGMMLDPNEIVDRLRLLKASRQTGHNGHNNEILSIIEELREAGLIIN
ncbi:hypothetical protein ALC57_11990 [Trachymyrmex cornetzi]|uniref:Uncharacterized protein n=1 Tax=Trachymyrmex cornetzi TaxID=471704 RepID=A0A151J1Q5_9HYME|nr:hypothetical protein ALC57_11990 [Trachymyrmex cornetzi]